MRAVAPTSIQVYRDKVEPSLNEKQQMVFSIIRQRSIEGRDVTNEEIARELKIGINHVSGRTTEMRKLGKVKCNQRRPCTVTGNNAQAWIALDYYQPRLFP